MAKNDRDLNTSIRLKFEGDRNHMYSPKCAACSQFKNKLTSMRSYRPAFIERTTNVRIQGARGNGHARPFGVTIKETARLRHHRVLADCSGPT